MRTRVAATLLAGVLALWGVPNPNLGSVPYRIDPGALGVGLLHMRPATDPPGVIPRLLRASLRDLQVQRLRTRYRARRRRVVTRATPRPPQAVTPVVDVLRRVARRYGIDPARFVALARCESGLRSNAVGGGGLYLGLFQQHRDYWAGRAKSAGFAGASPFDPVANASVSAWMGTKWSGGWSHWPVCAKRAGLA